MQLFLLNKLLSPIIGWQTPYQVILKKEATYSGVRCFGCLRYSTNPKPHKDKFSPRALKCIFLGFSPGQKGYKLYDLDQNQIFVSRDVLFYEQVYPYKNDQEKSGTTNENLSLPIVPLDVDECTSDQQNTSFPMCVDDSPS